MQAEITPVERQQGEKTFGLIGISLHTTRARVGLDEAVVLGARGVYRSSWLILDFLRELFQGHDVDLHSPQSLRVRLRGLLGRLVLAFDRPRKRGPQEMGYLAAYGRSSQGLGPGRG